MADHEKRIAEMYREAAKKQAEEARDTVRVVRCKDCKYSCSDCIVKDMLWCSLKESPDYAVRKDFFCACGERREVQNDD